MKRKLFNYICTFVITFLLGFSSAFAINLYNNGLIEGYGSANTTNRYSCPGKTWGDYPGYAGVIRIADGSSESYYCTDCSVQFPSTSEVASSQAFSYSSSGTCYYTCNNLSSASSATGSTYAEYQHQIWNLFKSGMSTISCSPSNDELLDACGGSKVYILEKYNYGSYQSVTSVISKTPEVDTIRHVKVKKVCGTGVSSTDKFNFVITDSEGSLPISLGCGETSHDISVSSGNITVTESSNSKYIVSYSGATSGSGNTATFTAPSQGSTKTVTFTNNTNLGSIKVNKNCTNGAMGTYTFSLSGGTTLASSQTITCSSAMTSGSITFSNLVSGTYKVTETGNLNNITTTVKIGTGAFSSGTSGSVVVTAGNTSTITFNNNLQVGGITITKKDGLTNNVLQGVTFKLMFVNGTTEIDAKDINENIIGNKTTDQNGIVTFTNLPYGKYKIVEVSNPISSYIIASPITLTINATSAYSQKIIYNNQIKLKINKTNIDGTTVLENAIFKIINKNTGAVYKEVTITSDENYIIFEPGEYIITETKSPIGYESLVNSISLKVNNDGSFNLENNTNNYISLTKTDSEYTLNVKNDQRKVSISKQDLGTKNEISGALFKLTKKDGTEVATWTSNSIPYRIVLAAGDYILTEVKAPNKYEDKKFVLNFNVDSNSKITTTDKQTDFFRIDDNKLIVFNVKPTVVPNTASGIKVVLIVVGLMLITVGGSFIAKNVKKNKIK